ncbi:MAG: hypothetical protein ABJA37_07860 [Ferruginibacter sp.]
MTKMILLTTIIFLQVNMQKATAQSSKINWDILQDVPFEEKYIKDIKGYMLFPKFPWTIKSMEGKIVEIEGYTIPVDKTGLTVALSANPYASCYFCGKSGPASVLTVKLKTKNTRYHIDDYKTFRGKLRLNATDIHEFYYVLEASEDITK